MNAPHAASTARARLAPTVPARAQALAAQLADLFKTDQLIVVGLNDAHHQLAAANDRLWSDPAVDALRVHHEVQRAFWAYQHASEQRRQLAVDACSGSSGSCKRSWPAGTGPVPSATESCRPTITYAHHPDITEHY